MYPDPQQRSAVPGEPFALLASHKISNKVLLRINGESADVIKLHRQFGVLPYKLQRLRQTRQIKGGSQNLVARDQLIQGLLHQLQIERRAQMKAEYVVIDSR